MWLDFKMKKKIKITDKILCVPIIFYEIVHTYG